MPPKADNPRLDPNFLGDRPGAATVRRQQNYLRPLSPGGEYSQFVGIENSLVGIPA